MPALEFLTARSIMSGCHPNPRARGAATKNGLVKFPPQGTKRKRVGARNTNKGAGLDSKVEYDSMCTLPRKKRRFLKVAFLLRKSVYLFGDFCQK